MDETATDAAERPQPGFGPALLLATLSAGAGVLHLVMAPIHASSSGVEAAGFALVGWLQLALAAFLLVRPTRVVLVTTAAANAAFILVWAISRTAGLPFGPEAGVAERVGAADLVTVALEVGAVALAVALYLRPGLLAGLSREALAIGAVVPIAALLVVTMVVVSPKTAQHDHGDAAAGTPVANALTAAAPARCDRSFNPKSYWTEAAKAGVDTGETATAAPAAAMGPMAGMDHGDGDDHGNTASPAAPPTTVRADPLEGRGSKKLDGIVARLGSDSEADAAAVVMALAELTDQEYEGFLYQLSKQSGAHHAAQSTSGDDTGGHGGHMGPTAWVPMTDAGQCDKLAQEIKLARETALKYPTAADADAAGWRKVTGYVPGIGAHYINVGLVDGTFEVDKPEMLLYDGNGPDAKVAGLSYYMIQRGDNEPTQGFTGHNDHSHRHIGLCNKDGVVVGPSTMSAEDCAAAGGVKAGGNAGWMSHAWVVPGCESPWGVFSGATPILDRQLGEQSGQNQGACAGSKARARYDMTPGEAPAPAPATGPTENAAGR